MIVVAIIGVLAALALYGAKRYLTAAKTSEAKDGVGAIARQAAIVFESEHAPSQMVGEGSQSATTAHVLCASANNVPASVPAGTKYQPSTGLNVDFGIGDNVTGWVCLAFSIRQPIYYQYQYHKGAGYVAVPLGAPDPGSNGFEAAAQGDTDGDGVFATFARTGLVNNTHVVIATQIFNDNPDE